MLYQIRKIVIFISVYYDVPAIINLVDIVNIGAYDYYTPERNPKEADYTSPIYTPQNRNPLLNADAAVSYWYVFNYNYIPKKYH